MQDYKEQINSLPKSRLVEADLLPTTKEERVFTPFMFLMMWVGISILLAVFTNAANMFPSLSIKQILYAVALGNFITVVILALNGDIGITHGIPFSVYLRAIYGYTGTYIPSIIRAIPACFWFGFQTYLGAKAINLILAKLFGLPETYGILIGIIIAFLIIQVVTTMRGIETIAKFETFITPLMLLVVFYLLYWILTHSNMTPSEIINTPAGTPTGQRYTFAFAITAMTGFWATMTLNIPDLTRHLKADPEEKSWFKRNWSSIWTQLLGIIPMMTLFAFIGATSMLTSGMWDPVEFIGSMDAPLILLIAILFLAFTAQWTTNVAANILPPANIFANVFAPKINFAKGAIISGVLAFMMQPWTLIDKVVFVNALVGISLGAVSGTMVSDYYFLRKRKLNILDLYKEGGQYKYYKNYNPIAFIAYIAGTIGGMLNMDWGFLIAGCVGGFVYYVLMKFYGVKKWPQSEIPN